MRVFVDIDETICTSTNKLDHNFAKPLAKRINKINKLYDEGHYIVYWTARGQITKKDWTELTKKQFKEWGVKYHELRLTKPYYDLFIDDKNIHCDRYFQDVDK